MYVYRKNDKPHMCNRISFIASKESIVRGRRGDVRNSSSAQGYLTYIYIYGRLYYEQGVLCKKIVKSPLFRGIYQRNGERGFANSTRKPINLVLFGVFLFCESRVMPKQIVIKKIKIKMLKK